MPLMLGSPLVEAPLVPFVLVGDMFGTTKCACRLMCAVFWSVEVRSRIARPS